MLNNRFKFLIKINKNIKVYKYVYIDFNIIIIFILIIYMFLSVSGTVLLNLHDRWPSNKYSYIILGLKIDYLVSLFLKII